MSHDEHLHQLHDVSPRLVHTAAAMRKKPNLRARIEAIPCGHVGCSRAAVKVVGMVDHDGQTHDCCGRHRHQRG